MKKLIMFFAGLILIALMFAALCMAGAIYDAGRGLVVEPWFFQINNLSSMRIGVPASPTDIGDAKIREMLIRKYVTEYFYVVPDIDNVMNRKNGGTAISKMSAPDVFADWQNGEAQVIQSLAEDRAMRLVFIDGEIYKPDGSDYWIVPYRLLTWPAPNDFSASPIVTRGHIFLNIYDKPGVRPDMGKLSIGEYLERGYDPAAVFKFRVTDVVVQ